MWEAFALQLSISSFISSSDDFALGKQSNMVKNQELEP